MKDNNFYLIPANYTDSGRLFGGLLAARNAVEAAILTGTLGYVELELIPMPHEVRIVVMVLTLLPLCVLAMVGVEGVSLTQYLGRVIHFLRCRKRLHYRKRKDHGNGEE